MVIFIPFAAAGLAVVAAGAVGVAVRRRKNKKKQQENVRQDREQAPRSAGSNISATEQRRPPTRTGSRASPTLADHDRTDQRPARRRKTIAEQRRSYRPQQRELPSYDNQSLVEALDQAIAKAAKDTLDEALGKPPYNRMTTDERTHVVRRQANAMRSALGGLRMPDYNEDITAAAYLLNYHPSHIGLAHAVVNQAVTSGSAGKLMANDTDRFHVVDLASGTLAMQFGIAIAVADALIRGEGISKVVVDSVDINPAMLKAGRMAWDNFVLNVQSDENLIALAESCQLIEPHRYVSYDAVPERDGVCWMSCLHGIYDESSEAVRRALYALYGKHRPSFGLMTCWGTSADDQNVNIAMRISPFRDGNWQAHHYFLPRGQEYDIPFLFNNREPSADKTREVGRRSGVLPQSWDIFWRPTDTAVLTYQRRVPDHGH